MRSSTRRPRFLLGAVVLALLGAVLAAPVPAAAAPAAGIQWTPCGDRLECATVAVPLDWSRPHGPTISLAVMRHLATDPAHRIGSLLINPGGPGDSGVDEVANRGAHLDALTGGRFDVVGWDPRGSNRSAPVSCFATAADRAAFWGDVIVPTTRADERRYLAKTVALAQRCGQRNGALLEHISMADQVRDLDHLRQLVGDRKLTFFGESNGTLMGQTYANMFPGRVRAMALDGIVDPIVYRHGLAAALATGLTDTDLVWSKFLSLCQAAGPDRCALAGHGPVAPRVDAFLARLRRAPMDTPAGPLTYGELLAAAKFNVPASPADWPAGRRRAGAGARGRRDHSQAADRRPDLGRGPPGVRAEHGADLCRRPVPADRGAVAGGRAPADPDQPDRRHRARLGHRRPVRVLAGPQRRPLRRAVRPAHRHPDPAGQPAVRAEHAAGQRADRRAAAGQRGAAGPGRARAPHREQPERLRGRGAVGAYLVHLRTPARGSALRLRPRPVRPGVRPALRRERASGR